MDRNKFEQKFNNLTHCRMVWYRKFFEKGFVVCDSFVMKSNLKIDFYLNGTFIYELKLSQIKKIE